MFNHSPCATPASLWTCTKGTYDRAGRYSVRITSPSGAATREVAAVGFIPVLTAASRGADVVLTWNGTFTLQSATNVAGPYFDLPAASSPFTNEWAAAGPQRFFRLRVGNPLLGGAMQGDSFWVSLKGSPGRLYTIQASSNLTDWAPLQKDASPFALEDPLAAPKRFYRALLGP